MRYLKNPSEFKSSVEAREYLKSQEEMLLQCLHGTNSVLDPNDIKHFIPALARYWKVYLNIPGIASTDRRMATVHCAELIRFGKNHKYSKDYRETIQDPQHKKASNLQSSLKRENSTIEDMVLVRDLRID